MDKASEKAVPLLLAILVAGVALAEFRPASAQGEIQVTPPITAKTDNDSVTVVVDWSPAEIQPGQNVDFRIGFNHPTGGVSLQHVNYNFEIQDASGNTVKSIKDIHTHGGSDLQTVSFNNTGSFQLVITILGTGINKPFDTTRSGTAQTALVVVPEFPVAPGILAAITGISIVAVRLAYRRK